MLGTPISASAVCRTSLTFPMKLVPILCVLTATCSPSRLLVIAPCLTGWPLSSFAVLEFACSLIALFTNSWARSRKESAPHINCIPWTSWNSRWLTCVFVCRLSRLLLKGWTIFVKKCCTISRISCTWTALTLRNLLIFSKLAKESHTLPPAKLLWHNCVGLTSDLCFRSAFDHWTPDDVSLPPKLEYLREFSSVQFNLLTPLGAQISWHSISSSPCWWLLGAFPIK